MNEDYRDILVALIAERVRFVVVGAHALAVHGVPRMTQDIDIFVDPTAENAARIWRALARFGAPLDSLAVQQSDFVTPDRVIQLGLPPARIDLMTAITAVTFTEAWASRVEAEMFGVIVPLIGRVELIRNKRESGRQKDRLDVDALEQ